MKKKSTGMNVVGSGYGQNQSMSAILGSDWRGWENPPRSMLVTAKAQWEGSKLDSGVGGHFGVQM
jgi:hypothetical protein